MDCVPASLWSWTPSKQRSHARRPPTNALKSIRTSSFESRCAMLWRCFAVCKSLVPTSEFMQATSVLGSLATLTNEVGRSKLPNSDRKDEKRRSDRQMTERRVPPPNPFRSQDDVAQWHRLQQLVRTCEGPLFAECVMWSLQIGRTACSVTAGRGQGELIATQQQRLQAQAGSSAVSDVAKSVLVLDSGFHVMRM